MLPAIPVSHFNWASVMMVIAGDVRTCENMSAVNKNLKNTDKKVYVIAQELELVKALSGNNKIIREKAAKRVLKWIQFRAKIHPLSEADFMRLWKGLFYAIWMADKPLVQEEQAERISSIVSSLPSEEMSLLCFKCGLQTLRNEWFGIDHLRLDKFLMFTRRLLRSGFLVLAKHQWNIKTIRRFNDVLSDTVLNTTICSSLGLTMHVTEIYMEELAKVSKGKLNPHLLTEFLRPFVKQVVQLKDGRQTSCIKKHIFKYLLEQSDAGLDYQEKFEAWSNLGYPGGSMDSMQKVVGVDGEDEVNSDDNDEINEEEGEMDPRAGKVDVKLPQLKFVSKEIVQMLKEYRFDKASTTKSRKNISFIIDWYERIMKGEYPFGVKKIKLPKGDNYSTNPRKALNRLIKFENKLLSKKKRKRVNDGDIKEVPTEIEALELNVTDDRKLKRKRAGAEENGFEECLEEISKRKRRKLDHNPLEIKTSNQSIIDKLEMKRQKRFEEKLAERKGKRLRKQRHDSVAVVRSSGTWIIDDLSCERDKDALIHLSPKTKELKNNTEKNGLFQQSEWETPAKDGEVEIFVPSKKYSAKKLKVTTPRSGKQVINPFSRMPRTPASEKKVSINLKLNKSQEITEHIRQVKNSPGIPFDGTKKPSKPLLKARINSPINPFYVRK